MRRYASLAPYALKAAHPDSFACDLFYLNPPRVAAIVEAQRADLRQPPLTRQEFLGTLEACGLIEFVRLVGDQ